MATSRDQCPQRGPGLGHTVDGTYDCEHCGAQVHDNPVPDAQKQRSEMYSRFIRALRVSGNGLEFCNAGQHAATDAYAFEGKVYCPLHRPLPGNPDNLQPGRCEWGRTHFATDGVWWLPPKGGRHGRWLCRDHRAEYIAEAVRRGFWRT